MIDHAALLARFRAGVQQQGIGAAYGALLQALRAALPQTGDWLALVQGLLQQGAPGVAAALAQEGLSRHPDALELRYQLGNALRLIGENQAAERELRAVLAMQPQHAGARHRPLDGGDAADVPAGSPGCTAAG